MTKQSFLTTYRAKLLAAYPWAQNAAKLHRFMESVETSINGGAKTWNHDGEAVTAAWREIGGKGKPTFKALLALA